MKCVACKDNNGNQNNTLVICDNCLNLPSLNLIMKTDAYSKYALNKNDLSSLNFAKTKINDNTFFSILYLIDDIEKAAIAKYGSRKNVIDKIKNRKIIKNEKKKRENDNKELRWSELNKHLIKLGLSRIKKNDSILCQDYIMNDNKYTIEQIGEMLIEMEFFNTKTNYKSVFQNLKKKMNISKNKYKKDKYDKLMDEIETEAKDICLNQYVKNNYMDHHKLIDEVPVSLKTQALKLSDKRYQGYDSEEDNFIM